LASLTSLDIAADLEDLHEPDMAAAECRSPPESSHDLFAGGSAARCPHRTLGNAGPVCGADAVVHYRSMAKAVTDPAASALTGHQQCRRRPWPRSLIPVLFWRSVSQAIRCLIHHSESRSPRPMGEEDARLNATW
jgi:hypothetical protein